MNARSHLGTAVALTLITALAVVLAMMPGGCAASGPASPQAASFGMFEGHDGEIVTFKVEGMACRNCAGEIARELMQVPGVKAAAIDFDSSTARVAVDADPAKAATMHSLQAAVEHWRQEHFAVKEDPNCLDPQRREELQRSGGK